MADRAWRPTSVSQVHVTVRDLQLAVRFYRDQLGLDFLFEVPGQQMAFLQAGDTRIYLGVAESPEFRSSPVLYFEVPDIAAAHAAMQELGVEFLGEPHVVHRTEAGELWMAFTRDPDGNAVAITEQRAITS
jgi:predicted enzyme related to lactoylglutathione lyase